VLPNLLGHAQQFSGEGGPDIHLNQRKRMQKLVTSRDVGFTHNFEGVCKAIHKLKRYGKLVDLEHT
jgi:hypothetical protein